MTQTRGSGPSLRVAVSGDDHAQGNADAPVTLVEYGDFQCPHCAMAHPIVRQLQARMGDQLRFVFRNFPITQSHPQALHAAAAAECVAALGGPDAYWRMHGLIYEHAQESRTALSDRHLVQWAEECGVDGADVQRALEAGTYEAQVQSDFMGGVRSGVNGTPTFFVNGHRFDENWTDVDAFEAALREVAGGKSR